MALIDYPDPADCDEQTRAILSQFANEHGEIPAFPRMLANKPAVLKAAGPSSARSCSAAISTRR